MYRFKKILMIAYFGIIPLQITTTYTDSTSTHLKIIGGLGRFIFLHTDCDGNIIRKEKIPFGELNITIDHKISEKPVRIGMNTNLIITQEKSERLHDSESGNYYWSNEHIPIYAFMCNPFLNAEWKYFAIGIGSMGIQKFSKDENNNHFLSIIPNNSTFSGLGSLYLRLGNLQSIYIDASLLHTPPIFAGSCIKAGLGFRLNDKNRWWIGTGAFPYDNLGLILKTEYKVRSRLYINSLLYYGQNRGVSEGGVSFGLTYGFKKNK